MSKVIRLSQETQELLEEIKKKYIEELEKEWLYVLNNTNDEEEWTQKVLRELSRTIEEHKRYTDSEWIYAALTALDKMIVK